jgi:MEMO1 family protein
VKRVSLPTHPQLRPIEIEPIGSPAERVYLLWDPLGLGDAAALPRGEAMLAALMNGKRTLDEILETFLRRTGTGVKRRDLERLIRRLERARLLSSDSFRRYYRREVRQYLRNPVRPAAFAGDAYPSSPTALRRRFARFFSECAAASSRDGPIDAGRNEDPKENKLLVGRRAERTICREGTDKIVCPPVSQKKTGKNVCPSGKHEKGGQAPGGAVCGILAPHIDPMRGGRVYAAAYRPLRHDAPADRFVIFGTAHAPLGEWFSVTRKDFDTPLGPVRTDRAFCDRLQERLSATILGRRLNLFGDELAHRREHSLEFQAVFLQYLFGKTHSFRIVPILVNSFQHLIAGGETPENAMEVHAFVKALRETMAEQPGRSCCISSADLAHLGPRFGDGRPVDEKRLRRQAGDDRKLLRRLCRGDSRGFFDLVARNNDRNRICGLAPTYLMLRTLGLVRGRVLDYTQAVEPDGSACVTFAAAAIHHGECEGSRRLGIAH